MLISAGLLAGLWLSIAVAAVSAHDGVARLQVGADRVIPGGALEVFGDMTTDDPVAVALVQSDGIAYHIADIEPEPDGHFHAILDLPSDLPSGTYLAVATSGQDAPSVAIVVGGAPIVNDGQPQGQDEGLLPVDPSAAAPVNAPVASAGPIASVDTALRPLSDPTGRAGDVDLVPIIALVGAIGALGLLVWRTHRSAGIETGSADLP